MIPRTFVARGALLLAFFLAVSGRAHCLPRLVAKLRNIPQATVYAIPEATWSSLWLKDWERDTLELGQDLTAFDIFQSLYRALELHPQAMTIQQAEWLGNAFLPQLHAEVAKQALGEKTAALLRLEGAVAAAARTPQGPELGDLAGTLSTPHYLLARSLAELPTSYPQILARLVELDTKVGRSNSPAAIVDMIFQERQLPLDRLEPIQRTIVAQVLAASLDQARSRRPVSREVVEEVFHKELARRFTRIRTIADAAKEARDRRARGQLRLPPGLPADVPPAFHQAVEREALEKATFLAVTASNPEMLRAPRLNALYQRELERAYAEAALALKNLAAMQTLRSTRDPSLMHDIDVKILSQKEERQFGLTCYGTRKQLLASTASTQAKEAELASALSISQAGWKMVAFGDVAVGASLYMHPKFYRADFLAFKPETGRFLIAETKSGRSLHPEMIGHALDQLASTSIALKHARQRSDLPIDYQLTITRGGIPIYPAGAARIETTADGRVIVKQPSTNEEAEYASVVTYVGIPGEINGAKGTWLFQRKRDGHMKPVMLDGQPVSVVELKLDVHH